MTKKELKKQVEIAVDIIDDLSGDCPGSLFEPWQPNPSCSEVCDNSETRTKDCWKAYLVEKAKKELEDTRTIYDPWHGANREDSDGTTCWCNGLWESHEKHHPFCRARRKAWFKFVESLEAEI